MKALFSARKIIFWISCLTSAAIAQSAPTNAPIRQISPGIFQVGLVRLNPAEKTVQFPAFVNMTNGLVEYLIVTGTGKLHESVLRTDVEPAQIHVAMLFIGTQGATNSATTNILGDKFRVKISYKSDSAERRADGEEFVFNNKAKVPMSKGAWIYNGSKIVDGTFIAQRDGSIVSIITDPLALANNPRPDRDDDEIWFVNTNSVPPLNTPVEVTFQLEK